MLGEKGLGVELHALHGELAVAHAHDLPVLGFSVALEAPGQGRAPHRQPLLTRGRIPVFTNPFGCGPGLAKILTHIPVEEMVVVDHQDLPPPSFPPKATSAARAAAGALPRFSSISLPAPAPPPPPAPACTCIWP